MSITDELSREFFTLSSYLAEPFCQISEWGHRLVAPIETYENRVLYSSLFAMSALVLTTVNPFFTFGCIMGVGALSRVFKMLACSLQKKGYTYVKGNLSERNVDELKVMTWNILGFAGGLTYSCGGCVPWRNRIDGIVEVVKKNDPDVLVLQEVFDTALADALVDRLKGNFSHFYIHLGPNRWGLESGQMVMTKCPVDHFSYVSFSDDDWKMNRGFSILETQGFRIVGTHLRNAARKEQFLQIMEHLKTLEPKATILTGDLNIERDSEEGEWLRSYLMHGYQGKGETCSNELSRIWKRKIKSQPDEIIDYISMVRSSEKGSIKTCFRIPAFDTPKMETALSDHHALVAIIEKKC